MRGRVFGAKPSHTKAVQFVNNTTHRQQPPSQPNPTKYALDGVISCPVNEVSTSSNKTEMTFHKLQKKSRNATEKSDENQTPGQSQPASTGPESTVSATTRAASRPAPRSEPPSPAQQRALPMVSASTSSTTRIRVNDRFNN